METPVRTAKAVFDHAHEIDSPAERKAYLDQVCADAPEIRQKVEALLQAYEEAGSSFLEKPALPPRDTGPYHPGDDTPAPSFGVSPETALPQARAYQPGDDTPAPSSHASPDTALPQPRAAPQPDSEDHGEQIGPYRLITELGEGGMGTVYLAQQEHPIRRQVALKIIKSGMDSAHVVARFEAERQALTMMDHVNIARVLDAGATDRGLPYFVMELVKGIPMTSYCKENTLTPRERLKLFATVCQAIQHAHQKGLIHRDIKPSNVLVALLDGNPVAKVIDFGLAKATEQPLTDHSRMTEIGAIMGTLEYMSPEQAHPKGEGIDTRTDVYSLGVMLYELLTGTTPLDRPTLRGAGFLDVVSRITQEETPTPSTRVSGLGERLAKIAAERKTEPASLAKLLRGELDWIALKALDKERNRRYQTASDFATDVQRYLDDEPVEACPPSRRYRVGKFARKHRMALGVATGFVTLLAVGVMGLIVGIIVAKAAQFRAEKAETRTRKALTMTWGGIRAQLRKPTERGEKEKTILRNMLEGYRQFLPELAEVGDSQEKRATAAEAEFRIANLSALLGIMADAEAGYRRAIELYESLANEFQGQAEYRNELARCNFDLAILLYEKGKRQEAEAAYRRAIALHEKLATDFPDEIAYRRELADVYNNLGASLRDGQELAKAEKAYREAIAFGENVVDESPGFSQYQINLAASYHNLGNAVRDQGNPKAALAWYGKAIDLLNPINPRPADATLFLRNACWDRANALGQLGRHPQASKDWEIAVALEGEGPDRGHLRLFLAASQMEEKLKGQIKPPGDVLYAAASVFAQATAAAAATGEAGLLKRYVERALELLKQAKTAGWFRDPQRIKQLKEDKNFASLPLADFKPFLESLEAGKGANARPERK